MKALIRKITEADVEEFAASGLGMSADFVACHKAVEFKDEFGHKSTLYLAQRDIDKLGIDYIQEHTTLRYSNVCNEWFAALSEDDYHNDLKKNPAKTVDVRFVTQKPGENTEVWQDIETGQYLLRLRSKEHFAKWMTCGDENTGWDDRCEVRPNLTFRNAGETETVKYRDWNGVAAYSDEFNSNFKHNVVKED